MQDNITVEKNIDDLIHPAEIANYIEGLPLDERKIFWLNLTTEKQGETLPYLHENAMQGILDEMPVEDISRATENMEASDLADVIDLLPKNIAKEITDSLSEEEKSQLEQTLQYKENDAGRFLDYDSITVTSHRTAGQVVHHIRQRGLPEYTDKIFIVGNNRAYLGAISLGTLLETPEDVYIKDIEIIDGLDKVDPNTSAKEMASLFRQKHYVSLPVVSNEGRLEGRITLDDAMSILQDQSDHQLMGLAGLGEEEDLFAPIIPSAKRRAVWLGINLLTAFLASWVIGLFEGTLERVVALAVLMPIVASMGGIAGSQTLTLAIRGFALKQINDANRKALLHKELRVGLLNGVIWASAVSSVTYYWFDDFALAIVIAIAIFLNIIAAAFAGVIVPVILKKMNIDPALSGSVILTTVTDVVGFLSFLGLGTLLLI
ncbi:MAG: magnesium transporter [Cellvibrionaceae bacterium]